MIGIILGVFIFKREIHELKIASYMLFISIITFIVVFVIEIGTHGLHSNPDKDYNEYDKFKFDRQFFTAVSVFITAYGF